MSLVIPRRTFLTGLITGAAAPALCAPGLVRASSLEFGLLRGWNLDPRVLALWSGYGAPEGRWLASCIPANGSVAPAGGCDYSLIRLSETSVGELSPDARRASQQLPLRDHLRALARVREAGCSVI